MANEDQWCFAWHAPRIGDDGQDRAALVKAAKWNAGDVITVSFLDGDPNVQQKVQQVAQTWTTPQLARLTFDLRKNTTDTFVRISFKYSGSWSVIGTTCKQMTDKTQPTMNYGWLTPQSGDDEIQRVVLHEFGHAIGCIHEHQSPKEKLNWDVAAVYKAFSGPPNNWSKADIDSNILQKYSPKGISATIFDKDSIMLYQFDASLFTDHKPTPLNTKLSKKDEGMISRMYPK